MVGRPRAAHITKTIAVRIIKIIEMMGGIGRIRTIQVIEIRTIQALMRRPRAALQ